MNCHLIDLTCIPDIKISLSSGYLEAFARSNTAIEQKIQFRKHCYYIGNSLEEIVSNFFTFLEENSEVPDIVGFTIYFWNSELSRLMARQIKSRFPSTSIIFGGNDITYQGEVLLGEESSVDAVCNGEGEKVLLNFLLQKLSSSAKLVEVNGLTFRDNNGQIITNPDQDRIIDLDEIPSPFQNQVFTSSDIENSRIIVYEFSRGCPFKCSFCYWGAAINTRVRRFSIDRIKKDLSLIIKHMRNNSTLFLADANFGMVKADIEIARTLVELLGDNDKTIFIFANWAKNTSRCVIETAKILFEGRLISSVTLSAQSLNHQVLEYAQRKNIPFEYYKKLQNEFKSLGIPTYTELLIGMPGESYSSFIRGVEEVLQSGGHPVIYPLLLLNNTEYSKEESRRRFSIKSRSMPYQMFNEYAQVETVVCHSELSEEEWLNALSFSLTLAVFYHVLLKYFLLKIQRHYNISYKTLIEVIHDILLKESLPDGEKVCRIFQNYRESWKDFRRFDKGMLKEILGENFIEDNVHYQAIIKVVLSEDFPRNIFIEKLCGEILKRALGQGIESNPQFSVWVKAQQIVVDSLSQLFAHPADDDINSESFAPVLRQLSMVLGHSLPQLSIRTEFFGSSFDTFFLAIYHGSIDTLCLLNYQAKIFDMGLDENEN